MFKTSMFDKYLKEKENEFMSHVSVEIQAIHDCGHKLSLERYKELRTNSYEDKYLEPMLSDEAFIWKIENAIKNVWGNESRFYLPVTYDEYLSTDGIKELLKRFKKLKIKSTKSIDVDKERRDINMFNELYNKGR